MTILVIVVAVAVVLAVLAITSYNRFVRQRQFIDNAWANVDTELRRRYDLIPNLVETVKGYATHEQATLRAVVEARALAAGSHGAPAEQAADEQVLVGALRSLLAVSEDYPDLKANRGFLDLQRQLTTTEDRIQAARRFYNNNVRDYNTRVQSVPTNLIAKAFGFDERDYFEIDEAISAGPAHPVSFED
jgi:LemA protein